MNYHQDEMTAEYNRQHIHSDIEQIRLERSAFRSQPFKPGRFSRLMFNLANWKIATGKQLRKRYEIPSANCGQAPSREFAH
jgi:hypothetical protein